MERQENISTPSLCDAHAHLARCVSNPLNLHLDSLLPRLKEQEVCRILSNATRPQDWEDTLSLTSPEDGIFCAIGVHPFFCEDWNPKAEQRLRELIASNEGRRIAAIGEIGLDGVCGDEALQRQKPVFARQLEIALEYGMPICLHLRKAWPLFWEVLKEKRITTLRGCCHNFTGSPEVARTLLNLGLHLSFGKTVSNPAARNCRRTALMMLPERILTETDCPDMGESPADAEIPLKAIAELRSIPVETLAKQVLENFRQLFG